MTLEEQLDLALNTLYDIGAAFKARELLSRGSMPEVVRKPMEAKALSDEAIEKLALDVWEEIVIERGRFRNLR